LILKTDTEVVREENNHFTFRDSKLGLFNPYLIDPTDHATPIRNPTAGDSGLLACGTVSDGDYSAAFQNI
jgi:hypothetical protein